MCVVAPAVITGTGEDKTSTIIKIEDFLHRKFVSIDYDAPDFIGNYGYVVTNVDALHILSSI